MSILNKYLVQLQCGQFATAAGHKVFYSGFGNLAFNLGLQCIHSYYCEFTAGAQLDVGHAKCNASMRGARIVMKQHGDGEYSLSRLCLYQWVKNCEESPCHPQAAPSLPFLD
jgi:hypothetical protein